VLDFNRAVVARTPDGWRVRGLDALRTLRAPRALGFPQGDVAGYAVQGEDLYIHLAGDDAEIRFATAPGSEPMLKEANARVSAVTRSPGAMRFALQGEVPLEVALHGACRVRADGRAIVPEADGRYRLPGTHAREIDVRCL
jgi:hypothetical protein